MAAVVPTGFATADPLPDDALRAAGPPRYPRPSRLATPLPVSPPKAAAGAERLGRHRPILAGGAVRPPRRR